jgi:hypothetical protein
VRKGKMSERVRKGEENKRERMRGRKHIKKKRRNKKILPLTIVYPTIPPLQASAISRKRPCVPTSPSMGRWRV